MNICVWINKEYEYFSQKLLLAYQSGAMLKPEHEKSKSISTQLFLQRLL